MTIHTVEQAHERVRYIGLDARSSVPLWPASVAWSCGGYRDSTTESSSRAAARTTPLPTHACADAGGGRRSAASGDGITAVRCGHVIPMLARQYRAVAGIGGVVVWGHRDSATESSSHAAARTTPLPTHACAGAGGRRRSAASGGVITAVRCGHVIPMLARQYRAGRHRCGVVVW